MTDIISRKYSPIAPIQLLQQIQMHGVLGDYLLVLAHDVLEYPQQYLDLIYNEVGDEGFVILDNSTVELGAPMEGSQLLEAANRINADCIVLPDVMGDLNGTIQASREAMVDLGAEERFGLMKIVQGTTVVELDMCIEWMHRHVPGNLWAVPRWITNEMGSRYATIHNIRNIDPSARIHLLGMSKNFEDDIKCAKLAGVMGIDSANPVTMGQQGTALTFESFVHLPRGGMWGHKVLHQVTLDNISYVRDALTAKEQPQ